MRIIIYFLLAVWGTVIAQGNVYEYSQLWEDFKGPAGIVSTMWRTASEEYKATYTSAESMLRIFERTRLINLDKAYGELLKELGEEPDPNAKSHKLEFFNYLGSLGWEVVWVHDVDGRVIYEFKRAIAE